MNATPRDDLRVYLIRHGRTALNAEDRLRGLADPELDETGTAEATATALALQRTGIEYVAASPLRRAERTAQIIAETCGAPWESAPGFNDRDYGPWTGKLRADVIAEWGSIDAAPGVEAVSVVRDRALAALESLAADRSGYRTIGVVTHDAVIRPILERIAPGTNAAVPTASWAVLDRTGDAWRVRSVDNLAPVS